MTIHEALRNGENLLAQNQIAEPAWNAERLLRLALKADRARFYSNLQTDLTEEEANEYHSLLEKRSQHYPLAYLEGKQEFFGRSFHVDPSVLIPRPETEEIIYAALSLKLPLSPVVIDLGAGSGCIAVTLSREINGSRVVALEYSEDAIRVVRKNAKDEIEIVRGNLYITPFASDTFDLVVSNPPYVEQPDYGALPPETKWEPSLALVVDSLEEIYDALLLQAYRIAKPGGYVIFEVGFGQEERIADLVGNHPEFDLLEIRKDFRDFPRTFVLRKS